MMHPTSAGVNSITVCQPMVMMFALPCQLEETSTTGPGSRYRRMRLTGKSLFSKSRGMDPPFPIFGFLSLFCLALVDQPETAPRRHRPSAGAGAKLRQAEHFARFGRGGRLHIQLAHNAHRARNQHFVRGQHALGVIVVVLKPDADMPAHQERLRGTRKLRRADRREAP